MPAVWQMLENTCPGSSIDRTEPAQAPCGCHPRDRYKSVFPARQECLEIPRVAHEAVAELRVIRMLGRCEQANVGN